MICEVIAFKRQIYLYIYSFKRSLFKPKFVSTHFRTTYVTQEILSYQLILHIFMNIYLYGLIQLICLLLCCQRILWKVHKNARVPLNVFCVSVWVRKCVRVPLWGTFSRLPDTATPTWLTEPSEAEKKMHWTSKKVHFY